MATPSLIKESLSPVVRSRNRLLPTPSLSPARHRFTGRRHREHHQPATPTNRREPTGPSQHREHHQPATPTNRREPTGPSQHREHHQPATPTNRREPTGQSQHRKTSRPISQAEHPQSEPPQNSPPIAQRGVGWRPLRHRAARYILAMHGHPDRPYRPPPPARPPVPFRPPSCGEFTGFVVTPSCATLGGPR